MESTKAALLFPYTIERRCLSEEAYKKNSIEYLCIQSKSLKHNQKNHVQEGACIGEHIN